MSDTVEMNDATSSPTSTPEKDKVVSKRGRRLLVAIIIILLLTLIGVSVALLNFVLPRGEIATGDDAGGLVWVKSIYGWGSTPDTQFTDPRELSIDNDGTIWVTDSRFNEALGFSPDGKLLNTVGKQAEEPIVGLGPMAVGPEDALFVGEPEMDRVRVFAADGSDAGIFGIPNPVDIDYRNGTMVIGTKFGFSIVDPNTGIPSKVVGTVGKEADQFDNVNGVTVAPDGTIYVVDTYNNRLSAYTGEGDRKWIVETGASRNQVDITGADAVAASTLTTAAAKLQLPSDVTVDGNGRVVVVDAFDFSISVFDPATGDVIAKYGEYGEDDGQLAYPSSIAYDSERDWFAVADSGNGRVQIVRIPGSGAPDALAAARRSLAGPLRACLFPLILLLIALVVYLVMRARRKKKAAQAAIDASAVADPGDVSGDTVAHE